MIYELRKLKSKNKKHRYIYQIIMNGEIVYSRNSNMEYLGCAVHIGEEGDVKGHMFFNTVSSTLIKFKKEEVALTFDALRLLCM